MSCSQSHNRINVIKNKIEDDKLKKYLEEHHNFKDITNSMLKVFDGSIQKAITINEKRQMYEEIENIFSKIEDLKIIDVLNKVDVLYKNKEDIYNILDYINIILFNKSKKQPKYLKYIDAVEQTKKSIRANNNYDMSIDSLLYKIWEE